MLKLMNLSKVSSAVRFLKVRLGTWISISNVITRLQLIEEAFSERLTA